MPWDLQRAKMLLGVPPADNTKDLIIAKAMETVLAFVEKKLGRGITLKTVDETYYNVNTQSIRVYRYPIKALLEVNGNPVPPAAPGYQIHYTVGRITPLVGWGGTADKVTLRYAGGYDPIPLDLEQVLWEILQTYWGTVDDTTGLPVSGGTGATVTAGSGDVSSVSFGPFGTVRYDVGATVVGGEATGPGVTADDQRDWGWLAPWAYILQDYRSEMAPTIAFA